MTCRQVQDVDAVERYLAGQLAETEREQFEEHYFACAKCFDALEAQRAVRDALRQRAAAIRSAPAAAIRRGAWWAWSAVAAAAAVIVLLMVRGNAPAPKPQEIAAATPPPDYAALAEVRPSRYEATQFRGTPSAGDTVFRTAMERYLAADYAGAVAGLRQAASLDPAKPAFRFFLGADELLAGQNADAADDLRAAAAIVDSPFESEARLLLAKALLRLNQPVVARMELTRVVDSGSEFGGEARSILSKLDSIR